MASTPTRDLQDEFLAVTRKSQETVVRAIKTWVETVRTVTPKLPSAYVPLADRLPKLLPSVTVPFADKLPKPEDVVASGYDFAEHLLALQRKFAEDLLNATGPLIPGNSKGPAAAPSAKREPAPVATAPAAPKAEPKPAVVATAPAASKAEPKPAVAQSEAKPAVAQSEAKPAVAQSAPKAPAANAEPAIVAPKTPAATAAPQAPAATAAPKTPAATAAP